MSHDTVQLGFPLPVVFAALAALSQFFDTHARADSQEPSPDELDVAPDPVGRIA